MAVHLKDIRAPRAAPSGLELVDMGHETCRVGDGILPLEAFTTTLRDRGYHGPLGIEHEPEDFDPREDARTSREVVERWWRAERSSQVRAMAPERGTVPRSANDDL